MKKLWTFLKNQTEYLMILIGIAVFIYSPYLFRLYDPTAAVYDVGVLQIFITAFIGFCVYQSVTWLIININWCPIKDYFTDKFTNDFNNLEPWQKIKVSLFIYFALLAALVMLSKAIPV